MNCFKNNKCLNIENPGNSQNRRLFQTLLLIYALVFFPLTVMSNTLTMKTPLAQKSNVEHSLKMLAPINEGFDNVAALTSSGWFMQNNSQPTGTTGWFQGNPDVFTAQAGATNSYIAANFNNTSGTGTISNWLLTPTVTFNNGDQIKFYTRTQTDSTLPDRLEVRLSTNGSSTDVGTTATSVGDFTTLLLTINPNLEQSGYPQTWTQYTLTLSGLPAAGVTARAAFRYFVTNAGPTALNANYIGIDTFQYIPAVVTAASVLVSGRVTTATGKGVRNALVILTSSNGESNTAITNAFGYYRFVDVSVGETYIFTVSSKRQGFSQNPQVRFIAQETNDINFVADN